MTIANAPILPFPSFKWRWASVAPTESLNEPKVYLGVLRAFHDVEGEVPRSAALLEKLAKVRDETGTAVNLARTGERNLVRNSGQYWKALGLLETSDPVILLTPFGRAVADGSVTMAEFAAATIASLTLPNERVQADYAQWVAANIQFRPLRLILEILENLKSTNLDQAYITKFELVKIVEPLSAATQIVGDFADTILAYRHGSLSLADWPNCAREANDHRMAAEFLLFLSHYGYCKRIQAPDAWGDKYYLEIINDAAIAAMFSAQISTDLGATAKSVSKTGAPDFVERQKVLREVLNRPGQAKFRKEVLDISGSECVVTGTQLEAALEAAHIIPVRDSGSDNRDNGFCMRSDIHTLFDSGHMRIDPAGNIHLSDAARSDVVYAELPENISIPGYVNGQHVIWRWNYY